MYQISGSWSEVLLEPLNIQMRLLKILGFKLKPNTAVKFQEVYYTVPAYKVAENYFKMDS